MTKDRDFKQQVRDRAGKTGQSYQATRQTMSGPANVPQTEPTGEAEVREMFRTLEGLWVAGCFIRSGQLNCWDQAKVVRAGVTVGEGAISSLRTYRKPVPRVSAGQQCGIHVVDVDLQVGDVLVVEATGVVQAAEEQGIDALLEATVEVTGQSREALLGTNRSPAAVLARQEAMYAMDYVGVERRAIAEVFGRPLGMVHQAVEKLEALREQHPELQAQLSDILSHFDASLAAKRAIAAR